MFKLKRFLVLSVMFVGLFYAQMAMAETEGITKETDYMSVRSAAIAEYLENKIATGSFISDDTDFFSANPEFAINNMENGKAPQKIDTIVINQPVLFKSNDSKKLVEVDFYSDGTYVVSELEKKMVALNDQPVTRAGGQVLEPINMVLGQNTHHIKNGLGQYVGRSYVEANFGYDGTRVIYYNNRANVRSLLNNYWVDGVGSTPTMSYPSEYNGQICRAEYQSFWYKAYGAGSTTALWDINRVSCNHIGQLFTTSPNTAI